jgi:hypothetical protein
MNKEEKRKNIRELVNKLNNLEFDVSTWRYYNSQSNPGAVMHLRQMKKQIEKTTEELKNKLREYNNE